MALRQMDPAHRPISLVERTQRLNEKMIATALVELEDWSPLRKAELAAPVRVPSPPGLVGQPGTNCAQPWATAARASSKKASYPSWQMLP